MTLDTTNPHAATERELVALGQRAWRLFSGALDAGLPVMQNSVPILYFGDSGEYLKSPLRVITVGKNPSDAEFPADEPFKRFPLAAGYAESGRIPSAEYLRWLNDYFRSSPHEAWFNPSFKAIITGLGASFDNSCASRGLHTGLCSPLATTPKWSQLEDAQRTALFQEGSHLWHDLVEALQPDVVLISIPRHYLDEIRFPAIGEAVTIWERHQNRRRPYSVEVSRRTLASGKQPLFVFGRAAHLPFGLISAEDKTSLGLCLSELLGV